MLEFWRGKYVTTVCIFCENNMPPCQRCKYPLVCIRDNDEDEDDEDDEEDVEEDYEEEYSILIAGQIPENHILFCTSCEKKAYCETCNGDNDVKSFYNNREIELCCSSCFECKMCKTSYEFSNPFLCTNEKCFIRCCECYEKHQSAFLGKYGYHDGCDWLCTKCTRK